MLGNLLFIPSYVQCCSKLKILFCKLWIILQVKPSPTQTSQKIFSLHLRNAPPLPFTVLFFIISSIPVYSCFPQPIRQFHLLLLIQLCFSSKRLFYCTHNIHTLLLPIISAVWHSLLPTVIISHAVFFLIFIRLTSETSPEKGYSKNLTCIIIS